MDVVAFVVSVVALVFSVAVLIVMVLAGKPRTSSYQSVSWEKDGMTVSFYDDSYAYFLDRKAALDVRVAAAIESAEARAEEDS